MEPLLRGHPDKRSTPLVRPYDYINLNINALISILDEWPPLLRGHISGAKRVASQEGLDKIGVTLTRTGQLRRAAAFPGEADQRAELVTQTRASLPALRHARRHGRVRHAAIVLLISNHIAVAKATVQGRRLAVAWASRSTAHFLSELTKKWKMIVIAYDCDCYIWEWQY